MPITRNSISKGSRNKPITTKTTGHNLRILLTKLHWFLNSQLGISPLHFFRSLKGIPVFLNDWKKYRKKYDGPLTWKPCLHDRYAEGGATKSEYFWQDLLVARWIYKAQPHKHVDIGSRVDGFVAHVASFREIEVYDIRHITTRIPGVVFKQADLMNSMDSTTSENLEYCDSLSCLHAIEHFGLGRYGDPINPRGHEQGIANMAALLSQNGTFYLSVPIGRERVEFNANRVFDPKNIIQLAERQGFQLKQLTVITPDGTMNDIDQESDAFHNLAKSTYNLGIFIFTKIQHPKKHYV